MFDSLCLVASLQFRGIFDLDFGEHWVEHWGCDAGIIAKADACVILPGASIGPRACPPAPMLLHQSANDKAHSTS